MKRFEKKADYFFDIKKSDEKCLNRSIRIFDKKRWLLVRENNETSGMSRDRRSPEAICRDAVVNREHSTDITGQQVDQIKEKEASNKCMRHVYKCDSTYLSPSSLKKSPPPRSSPPRSRKRKRGGNAGRSPPISRDVANVLSEIILRCEFPPVFHQQCRYPVALVSKVKGFSFEKSAPPIRHSQFLTYEKKTSNITTGQPLAGS